VGAGGTSRRRRRALGAASGCFPTRRLPVPAPNPQAPAAKIQRRPKHTKAAPAPTRPELDEGKVLLVVVIDVEHRAACGPGRALGGSGGGGHGGRGGAGRRGRGRRSEGGAGAAGEQGRRGERARGGDGGVEEACGPGDTSGTRMKQTQRRATSLDRRLDNTSRAPHNSHRACSGRQAQRAPAALPNSLSRCLPAPAAHSGPPCCRRSPPARGKRMQSRRPRSRWAAARRRTAAARGAWPGAARCRWLSRGEGAEVGGRRV
jgi:hypothetical protein